MSFAIFSKIENNYSVDDGKAISLKKGENLVSPGELECLMKSGAFQKHMKNGYITIAAAAETGEDKLNKKPKK